MVYGNNIDVGWMVDTFIRTPMRASVHTHTQGLTDSLGRPCKRAPIAIALQNAQVDGPESLSGVNQRLVSFSLLQPLGVICFLLVL